jgi:replication initiation protein RepC
MGDGQASLVLAAILQRGAAIKSPGGYLRILALLAATGSYRSGRCCWRSADNGVWSVIRTTSCLLFRTIVRKGDPVCPAPMISACCVAVTSCWNRLLEPLAGEGVPVTFGASAEDARFA